MFSHASASSSESLDVPCLVEGSWGSAAGPGRGVSERASPSPACSTLWDVQVPLCRPLVVYFLSLSLLARHDVDN